MLSLALTLVLGAAAGLPAEADPAVVVAPARVRLVTTPRDLAEICGTRTRIGGCTEFRGQVLIAACREDGGTWRMDAEAQFVPYLFLWNPRTLWHEWDHVGDIHSSAQRHLSGLMGRRYATEAGCVDDAAREAALFPKRMDGWKRASSAKRHARPVPDEWRGPDAPVPDDGVTAAAAP